MRSRCVQCECKSDTVQLAKGELPKCKCGGFVVEINLEPNVISNWVDESILGMSGELLPELLREVWNLHIK